MNRLLILAVVLIAAVYVFFSSLYVVNEREQAIVLRFGSISDVKMEPGLYFKIPTDAIDSVQIIEDRLLRYDLSNMTVQVQGGAFYEVDAFLTYRIADPRKFRASAQGDLRVAENLIGTRFTSALRQVYSLRNFNAALSEQRPEMMREARDLIRPDVEALGIEIVDVRILRTDLSSQVSERTYERMRAERLAEAALLRANGQQAADTIKAIADRQAVEIRAEAQRDADILRGEGDAERSKIFAAAYNADPEFFQFYRSMESYRNALGSDGTTMVLSPDSSFFQYFGDAGQGTPGQPLPEPATPIIPETTIDVPANELPDLVPDTGTDQAPAPGTETLIVPPAETTPAAPATETPAAPATDIPATPAPAETQPATP
jgi:membrane protease subunit HflC